MSGSQPLKGQKALVTGANSGIGEGVAHALAAAGADVAVNYVARPEDAARVVAKLKRLGVTAMAIRADRSSASPRSTSAFPGPATSTTPRPRAA
jgi:NAD(P)-dependent dehydrogenase (short-subunit alcohol dehydrogenase family)